MKKGILLINTTSRFCEVGLFAATQTVSGALVLRRVLSLGSLWELGEAPQVPEDVTLGVITAGYEACYSEGFVEVVFGNYAPITKLVAAVIDSDQCGVKTAVRGFQVALFPGGELYLPRKQAVQRNENVVSLAREFLSRQRDKKVRIVEGQSNLVQRVEIWPSEEEHEIDFELEHNGRFKDLVCVEWRFKRHHSSLEECKYWAGPADPVQRTKGQLNFYCHLVWGNEDQVEAKKFMLSTIAAGSAEATALTGLDRVSMQKIAAGYFAAGWRLKKGVDGIVVTSPAGDDFTIYYDGEIEPEVQKKLGLAAV